MYTPDGGETISNRLRHNRRLDALTTRQPQVLNLIRKDYVQPSTAAVNVTLHASAAKRYLLPLLRRVRRPPLSIHISCPPGQQQQTRRTLLQGSTAGTDRRTHGRTPYRYVDPASHYVSSVNKLSHRTLNNGAARKQHPLEMFNQVTSEPGSFYKEEALQPPARRGVWVEILSTAAQLCTTTTTTHV